MKIHSLIFGYLFVRQNKNILRALLGIFKTTFDYAAILCKTICFLRRLLIKNGLSTSLRINMRSTCCIEIHNFLSHLHRLCVHCHQFLVICNIRKMQQISLIYRFIINFYTTNININVTMVFIVCLLETSEFFATTVNFGRP